MLIPQIGYMFDAGFLPHNPLRKLIVLQIDSCGFFPLCWQTQSSNHPDRTANRGDPLKLMRRNTTRMSLFLPRMNLLQAIE